MSASNAERPREVTGRMVLICLIAFFGVVTAVNAVMIRAATSTFGGVETGSSYQAGLAFKRETEAAREQDARHWQVRADVRLSGDRMVVEIDARDAGGKPIAGLVATAVLHHPTDARADHEVAVNETTGGHFHGTTIASPGQWDIRIELARDGERLFRSRSRIVLQ